MTQNAHGLGRNIPAEIKRLVRQRDGFGCVVCGKAVYDYEHFDPEFHDAREHAANGITLLCSEHHRLKTSGMLSSETIRSRMLLPKAKEQGFSFGPFDIGTESPEIVLGPCSARNVDALIHLFGDDVLSIAPPSEAGLPFMINARLVNRDGFEFFAIENNEWQTNSENWDVEVSGPRIVIRRAKGNILFRLRTEPPLRLVFERLDILHRGVRVIGEEGYSLEMQMANGERMSLDGPASISDSKWGLYATHERWGFGAGVGAASFQVAINSDSKFPKAKMPKIGRNEKCPCGLGRKFKRCCGR